MGYHQLPAATTDCLYTFRDERAVGPDTNLDSAVSDAEAALNVRLETPDIHGLAGLGTADLDDPPSTGGGTEIMVEVDDALHFRARKIERFGDGWNGVGGNTTESVLHRVQDFDQGARPARMRLEGRGHHGLLSFVHRCRYPLGFVPV